MPEKSPWIVETTAERFEEDVIQRSHSLPVVVDFWAAWCHPCRTLGPVLERLAQEHAGAFILVKADTEQMPQVAAAFGVQAIPAVFAVREGAVVHQFTGLLPEPQIRQWLAQVLPSQAEKLAAEARALEVADPQAAEARYRQALAESPNDVRARVGLSRVLLHQDRANEAEEALRPLVEADLLDQEGQAVHAEIAMRRGAGETGSLHECRQAAEANPGDMQLQLNLAKALAAAGRHEEAMQTALAVVERDRANWGEPARELMVQLFHLLGDSDPMVNDYRRKLAMALY